VFLKSINLFAVGVSTIASFFIGFVWFTVIFRHPYLAGLGKSAEQLAKGPSTLEASVLQLAGNLVMSFVLARIIVRTGQQTVIGGMQLGVLVWLGFIAAVIGPMYAFQAFSLQFFAITAGYPLVALLVMGAILGGWKGRRP
jgi:hypothetical protein